MRALSLLSLLLIPAAPAFAQSAAPSAAPSAAHPADRYEACAARTASDPAGALAEAQGWRGAGGGAPARHCEAMALAGLGRGLEAAVALESLAMETPLAAQRGEIFLQAADLRLEGGDASGAQTDYGHALSAAPSAAAYEGRARARAALNEAAGAAADLAEAIRLSPQDSELRSLHAAALRRTGDAAGALRSAEAAVQLAPSSSLALYERGAARRALGDSAGAQADWREALARDPNGAGAALARAALR